MMTTRRDLQLVLDVTRRAINEFEQKLDEFATVLDDIDGLLLNAVESQRGNRGDDQRKG